MPYDWLIVEANQKRDAEQSQMTWNIEQKKHISKVLTIIIELGQVTKYTGCR